MQAAATKYDGKVETKIYYAGKDMEYIKKYGLIFSATMIINEKKKITRISNKVIEKEIAQAVKELEGR